MSHFMKFPHVIQNGGPRSKRCSSFVEKRKQCYSRNEANPNYKLLNYVGVLFDSNLKSLNSYGFFKILVYFMERLTIIKRNVFRIIINICIDYGDRDI